MQFDFHRKVQEICYPPISTLHGRNLNASNPFFIEKGPFCILPFRKGSSNLIVLAAKGTPILRRGDCTTSRSYLNPETIQKPERKKGKPKPETQDQKLKSGSHIQNVEAEMGTRDRKRSAIRHKEQYRRTTG